MSKAPRENRVPIMMSDNEVASIDDWRYRNRVATRSDAIRRLCQISLALDAQSSQLYTHSGKLNEAVGQLISTKGEMFSGAEPVDLEKLGKLMDDVFRHAIDLSLDTAVIARTHLSMTYSNTSVEETMSKLEDMPADLRAVIESTRKKPQD